MRRVVAVTAVAVGVLALSALVAQQTPQIPARSPVDPAARSRPGDGRDPEWAPPRITEYKPRTTLVVDKHPRPRAKFPVIDIHSHQPTPISQSELARVVQGMEQNNLRLLVNLSGGS